MRKRIHLWGRCAFLGVALVLFCLCMNAGATALDPQYEAATTPRKVSYCGGRPGDGHGYCWRNCTSYVAYKLASRGVPPRDYQYLGNAKDWVARARRRGIATGTTPRPGAVAYWTTGGRGYGHVAWVTMVNSDGSVQVSSYNGFSESYLSQTQAKPEGYVYFSNVPRTPIPRRGNSLGDARQRGSLLKSGQLLRLNSYLAPKRRYALVLQPDGNLVLYKNKYQVLWHTGTYRTGADRLIMQGDGNLVLYDGPRPVWGSHTRTRRSGAFAAMQSDGNFVVYSRSRTPLWSSGTNR